MRKRRRNSDTDDNYYPESERKEDVSFSKIEQRGINDDEWLDLLDPASPKAKPYATTWERLYGSDEKVKNEQLLKCDVQEERHSPFKKPPDLTPVFVGSHKADFTNRTEDDNSVSTVPYYDLEDEDSSLLIEENVKNGIDREDQNESSHVSSCSASAFVSAKGELHAESETDCCHIPCHAKAYAAASTKRQEDESYRSAYAYGRTEYNDDEEDDGENSRYLTKKRPWARAALNDQNMFFNYITPSPLLSQLAKQDPKCSASLDEDDRKMPAKPSHLLEEAKLSAKDATSLMPSSDLLGSDVQSQSSMVNNHGDDSSLAPLNDVCDDTINKTTGSNIFLDEQDDDLQQALIASLQDAHARKEPLGPCIGDANSTGSVAQGLQLEDQNFVHTTLKPAFNNEMPITSQKKSLPAFESVLDEEVVDLCESPMSITRRSDVIENSEKVNAASYSMNNVAVNESAPTGQSVDETFVDLTQDDEAQSRGRCTGTSDSQSSSVLPRRKYRPKRDRRRQGVSNQNEGGTHGKSKYVGDCERLRQMEQAHKAAAAERRRTLGFLNDLETGKYHVGTSPLDGSPAPSISRIEAKIKAKLSPSLERNEDFDDLLNVDFTLSRRERRRRANQRKQLDPKNHPSHLDVIVID